jgi:hypothetical protein
MLRHPHDDQRDAEPEQERTKRPLGRRPAPGARRRWLHGWPWVELAAPREITTTPSLTSRI